jgi:hypothetical protein
MNAPNWFPSFVALLVLTASPSLAAKEEGLSVRIRDGRVQEHVNGSLRRSYGSGLVDAATDGKTVVAVTRDGRIQEWVKGSMRRSYGSKVKSASIQGSKVFAQLQTGKTAEYENGSLRRTF